MGLERVTEVDPYDMEEVERVLREELAFEGPSVVIAKAPCVLQFKIKRPPYRVDAELCIGCKRCLQAGCMALNLLVDASGDRKVEIQADQCAGCGVCSQLCKEGAILPPNPGETGLKGAYAKGA
jgi:indolepyruvate ferredoxin oxidoreductase alpha subunit